MVLSCTPRKGVLRSYVLPSVLRFLLMWSNKNTFLRPSLDVLSQKLRHGAQNAGYKGAIKNNQLKIYPGKRSVLLQSQLACSLLL